jgi:hypothetical protein
MITSQDEEHKKDGDLDKVMKSMKTGFGSILGMFDSKPKNQQKDVPKNIKSGNTQVSRNTMELSMNSSVDSSMGNVSIAPLEQ